MIEYLEDQDDGFDPYGEHVFQWPTVSLLYGDTEAYIAAEVPVNAVEFDKAIAQARVDGFEGEILMAHTDDYGDDASVHNYTIADKAPTRTTLIGHRSFSSMTSWLRCGKAWQLERDFKVPTTPAWWFIGGSAFHLCVERYLKATLGQIEPEELDPEPLPEPLDV